MRRALVVLACLGAVAACHDFDQELQRCRNTGVCVSGVDGGSDAGETDGGDADAGAADTCATFGVNDAVTVRVMNRYFTEDSGGPVPEKAIEPLAAGGTVRLLLGRSDGGYVPLDGARSGDGKQFEFSTTGTLGEVLVEVAPPDSGTWGVDVREYVLTSAPTVDVGRYGIGRLYPDFAPLPASLELTFDGLDPWAAGDELRMTAVGIGIGTTSVEVSSVDGGALTIPAGATTAAWAVTFGALLDTTLGDVPWFSQHRTEDFGLGPPFTGVGYRRVVRSFRPTSLVQSRAAPTPVPGTFQALPATLPVAIALDTAALEDLALTGALPSATYQGVNVRVMASPGPPAAGVMPFYSDNPPVLPQILHAQLDARGAATLTAQVPNEFPASWPVLAFVTADAENRYLVPGRSSVFLQSRVRYHAVLADMATQRPFPLDGARNLAVDGRDARTAQTGLSLTPEVHWDAPEVGRPSSYTLDVYRMNDPRVDSSRVFARFVTRKPRLRIPPGVLTANTPWVFRVTAHSAPNGCAETQPFVRPLPEWSVDTMSALLTTAP